MLPNLPSSGMEGNCTSDYRVTSHSILRTIPGKQTFHTIALLRTILRNNILQKVVRYSGKKKKSYILPNQFNSHPIQPKRPSLICLQAKSTFHRSARVLTISAAGI